ncbi:serine/threonine protein kinase [Telmatocola sphagniphila]|nr:serine/threonine-protein kinase [Telmatocola sphagniphila]
MDQGGMGLVYEGYDVLGRHLAIKMIRASRMSATSLARFQEEAEAMAHLEHDNIAQVLSFGTVNGDPYYVMKYFKGGSLAKRMAEFQKDPKKSLLLIAKISNAVEFLHSKGHLHRDIKPQNILLDENDEPHLSDFGLVKRVTEDPALQDESSKDDFLNLTEQSSVETTSKIHKTAAGFFLGTPGYSSPEQAKGLLNAAGPHWDTWSLGVILYELMTGRKPFPFKSLEQYSAAINEKDAQTPIEINPKMDKRINQLIMSCLARDPNKRLRSAQQIEEQIRKVVAPPKRNILIYVLPLLAITIALYFAIRNPNPQEVEARKQAAASKKLASGEAVEIVRPDGEEVVPILFGSPSEYSRKYMHYGLIHLESDVSCLADCLKSVPVSNFTFQFDFRYNSKPEDGAAIGIYCDRQEARKADVVYQQVLMCKVMAADFLRAKKDDPMPFAVHIGHTIFPYDKNSIMTYMENFAPERLKGVQKIAEIKEKEWHTFRLEAQEKSFIFSLDSQVLYTLRRPYSGARNSSLDNFARTIHGNSYKPDQVGNACGIHIMQGGIQIRNVRVEPLR